MTTPRIAYLLALLVGKQSYKLGELTAKLRTSAAKGLDLSPASASVAYDQFATEGYVRVSKVGRSKAYELTNAGEVYLGSIRVSLPFVGRGAIVPSTNDQVRTWRIGFILFQVLSANEGGVTDTDANNQLTTYARDTLELNAVTAAHIRRELVERGLLAWSSQGQTVRFTLTTAGRLELGSTSFPEMKTKLQLTGRALNALLETAREVGKQFAPELSPPTAPPTTAAIEHAILESFDDLLGERHHVTGLVPIHEIRSDVRTQLGVSAARHDVFDAVLLGLRHSGTFRLVPLSNPRGATEEQLQASVPGMGETLFYLEAARERVAR